ncbi:haloacid dehalogenase superfamily, subfamily IA, variant 3 with third motif having DD or ED [Pseudomonas cuatrocienegasensis]|uniref:Haloacid dehalogenase superfamily, subfamily IA, variant 3 with third motif having DD or ED n=1 Tax=Pseudomonas cuatrocienegasensis TaxID=543360 RepID=A0ABY1B8A7_9PSED|nr:MULTISPECIES: HAD-IA family hydrolase [Pseudomonas]OEC35821.1 HAD family hydrolase [Pseudomonas sp. 21C1]SEQ20459.1 haloacid dehalogenase superfamily, subfamily IA, variant 3 with third motif having DD or ED [Pseudomonas cuatrocienegasensis]
MPSPANAHIDLLISDCDGVLIDSEIIAERVLHEALILRFPKDEVLQVLAGTFGLQGRDILARVERHFDVQLPEAFRAELQARTEALLRDEVAVIPGAREALMAIELPLAVASNSHLAAVERALRRCALTERVNRGLFTAEQVARPKPAPDVYLLAAQSAGVEPARCLVIEDSTTGATAALTAGMRVLGFLGASHIPPEHGEVLRQLGVEQVFDDMRALPELVARLCNTPPPYRQG